MQFCEILVGLSLNFSMIELTSTIENCGVVFGHNNMSFVIRKRLFYVIDGN